MHGCLTANATHTPERRESHVASKDAAPVRVCNVTQYTAHLSPYGPFGPPHGQRKVQQSIAVRHAASTQMNGTSTGHRCTPFGKCSIRRTVTCECRAVTRRARTHARTERTRTDTSRTPARALHAPQPA